MITSFTKSLGLKLLQLGGLALVFGANGMNLAVAGDDLRTADKILYNGQIYTMETDRPQVEAVAIRDGKFLALGATEEMQKLAGVNTVLIDLEGRMALPGLNDGRTPLHHAAAGGHTDTAIALIKRGARPHPRDEANRTPLNTAMRNGHIETADTIREEITLQQALRAELRSIMKRRQT